MQKENTITSAAREEGRILLAKSKATGLYFNGVNFSESNPVRATEIRPGTTAEDFELVWGKGIEIVNLSRQAVEVAKAKDPYMAARAFLKFLPYSKGNSRMIRLSDGKCVSRRVIIPARSNEPAWIRLHGTECAIRLQGGELCCG